MQRNFQLMNRLAPVAEMEYAHLLIDEREQARINIELPFKHLGVFARAYETSKVLQALPVYAIAQLGIMRLPELSAAGVGVSRSLTEQLKSMRAYVPLGQIGTDHVGYGSFDLAIVGLADTLKDFINAARGAINAAVPAGQPQPEITVGLVHLWVFPFADTLLVIDALLAGDIGPDHVVLRMEFDAGTLTPRIFGAPMATMQSPSLLDWRLSPSSFTLASPLLIGEDGCETLLPANLSTQQVRFRQVIRLAAAVRAAHDERRAPDRLGRVVEYLSEWFSIGHSLGKIEYSLPLAPAEKVKIAIVDWSRRDAAQRDEKTKLDERLTHDQQRNRSLFETVQGVVSELQEGSNFQAGMATSAGAGASLGIVDLGVGATNAIGGGTSETSGVREVQADTMQQIADAFHQSSSAIRELESTVVMQVDQSESSNVQTRTVANYNHGHALTILYYQVLRHFRLVTRVVRERNALIFDYSDFKPNFQDTGYLLDHRAVLEQALLDVRLLPIFEKLEGAVLAALKLGEESVRWNALPKVPDPGDMLIERLEITFVTGGDGTDGDPFVDLFFKDGGSCNTNQIGPSDTGKARRFGRPGFDDFEAGDVDTFSIRPEQRPSFKWSALRGFVIGLDGGGDWSLSHVKLRGFSSGGDAVLLYDQDLNVPLPNDTTLPELITIGPPPPAPKPPAPSLRQFLSVEDDARINVLKSHLAAHLHHYLRAIWLSEDPNDRAVRFANRMFRGEPVLDWIVNRPLEVLGDAVAFEIFSGRDRQLDAFDERRSAEGELYVEQLLTLPTRGIFAEAKLGHCNANEFIDKDRFWDWQTSPIPDDAPAISGADAGSRYQAPTGLTPTAFPQSLVNIVNPQALPDPSGLAGALSTLAASNVFRDMSGSKETAALLATLSNNATQLALEGLKGAQVKGMVDTISSSDDLTQQQKSDLIGEYLTGQVKPPPTGSSTPETGGGGGGQSPTTPTTPATPTTPTPPAPTNPAPGGSTPPSPVTPTATPKPKRPAGDVSTKNNGLTFSFAFRRALVGTPVEGTASIRIAPTSTESVTPEGEFGGYVPGASIGPPPKGMLVPKSYTHLPISDSSVSLTTSDASAPGDVVVEADYKVKVVKDTSPITSVFYDDQSLINLEQQTLHFTGPGHYDAPKSGKVVTFEVTPTIITKTYEVSADKKTIQEYSTEAEVSYQVISAKAGAKMGNEAGSGSKQTITLTYVTGGLSVKQTNAGP